MYRTRVGYSGGTKENPSYYNLGDHTETLEVDFDPKVISYRELSKIYWESHNPCYKVGMRQYMSIVFYHNEEQRIISEEFKESFEKRFGRVYTELQAYSKFYLAEAYHQKYYMQLQKRFMEEFSDIYPNMKEFINSTAAARINGYVKGYGSHSQLEKEINTLGLSEEGKRLLADLV